MTKKIFIQLLQIALGTRDSIEQSLLDTDWQDVFVLAQQQSVEGVLYSVIDKVSLNGIKPPLDILYQWIGVAELIKAKNELLNKRCIELSQLFSDAGFRSCILKGQGNALMYPNHYSRTSGDIDIWVEGERIDIRRFVKNRCPNTRDEDLHIQFPIFDDAIVEVHYKPAFLNRPRYNRLLQEYFISHADQQFTNFIKIDNKDSQICVPTSSFNLVYQMAHMYKHFFQEGLGMRHLLDYYFLLRNIGEKGNGNFIAEDFEKFGLLRFAQGIMWIESNILGIEKKCLVVEPNAKAGELIMSEVFKGGNFGHHNRIQSFRTHGAILRGLIDFGRTVSLFATFPSESMWQIYKKIINQKEKFYVKEK